MSMLGGLVVFTSLVALILLFLRPRSKLPLPPGPRKWPFIGNLPNIPTNNTPWVQYKEWSKQYKSDIIHIAGCGTSLVLLNSLEVAEDLVNRRSSICSSRPPLPMLTNMGWGWAFAFMPYGENWRKHRRLFSQELNEVNVRQYHGHISVYRTALLQRTIKSPERFLNHLKWSVSALVISISYGLNPVAEDDPHIVCAQETIGTLSDAGILGTFLVDLFPVLRYLPAWFPGAAFQRAAARARVLNRRLIEVPFQDAKTRLAQFDSTPISFISKYLPTLVEVDSIGDEMLLKNTIAAVYAAGPETTIATLNAFIGAMLMNPDVQHKAQLELDRVLGGSRLPRFEDRDTLPYTYAVILETLRWQPVVPLGLPHFTTMEDRYSDYYIPKNSIVTCNIWAMTRDETMFPEPECFRPERFLCDGQLKAAGKRLGAVFGFGRRICPGRFLALDVSWIMAASILATFKISNPIDERGNVIEPDLQYEGVVRPIKPVQCHFQPRSDAAISLIENMPSFDDDEDFHL